MQKLIKSGERTESYQFVDCPKCGEKGQLKCKIRTNRKGIEHRYYSVHHYEEDKIELRNTRWGESGFRGRYLRMCYLGKDI